VPCGLYRDSVPVQGYTLLYRQTKEKLKKLKVSDDMARQSKGKHPDINTESLKTFVRITLM